jgi:hypothetical protein
LRSCLLIGVRDMAQVFLHYTTPRGVVLNQTLTKVNDLTELRDYAVQSVQTLISAPSLKDWRQWVLHVRDDLGSELFTVPFASLLGEPN